MRVDSELAQVFFDAFRRIILTNSQNKCAAIFQLRQVYELLIERITESERILFPTFFSRLSFASSNFSFSADLKYWAHYYRRIIQGQEEVEDLQEWDLALYVLGKMIEETFDVNLPKDINQYIPRKAPFRKVKEEMISYSKAIRGLVLSVDSENNLLHFNPEKKNAQTILVRYNELHRNENFNSTILALGDLVRLPVAMNLIEVEKDGDDIYHPAAFVLEPDFLLDVTAVAECFGYWGNQSSTRMIKRFLPRSFSKYLLLGNVANHLLDELVVQNAKAFNDLKKDLLAVDPLSFCLLDDAELIELIRNARSHYQRLSEVVYGDFSNLGIDPKSSQLEPSFFSSQYGIQGRLDLLHLDESQNKADIVELKSGKAFRPNVYGLAQNHYVQTLLYDLMIQSTYQSIKPTNYILYSGESQKNLRYAPTIKAQQMEALKVRNELVISERMLSDFEERNNLDLLSLAQELLKESSGFTKEALTLFVKVMQVLESLEKDYFHLFSRFIAREHQLAKLGEHGFLKSQGFAGLWRESITEKRERFAIFSRLRIENLDELKTGCLKLKLDPSQSSLSQFRTGDICVLYPFYEGNQIPSDNQLIKGSILSVGNEIIEFKLRSKQINPAVLEAHEFWNIEGDLLDSSFNHYYRNLFEFAQAGKSKRALILGQRAPMEASSAEFTICDNLTKEQKEVLHKILNAREYFLLWGPPGTGKTKVVLRELVKQLHSETDEHILLLSYTNRAVDEICESISSISEDFSENYIRIGSKYGTGKSFQDRLLDHCLSQCESRIEIRNLINDHRIFTATVSSALGKVELFKMKQFDTVIIDEASQLIEPMLVGLLSRFKRFILIGDHKQLPAVVKQASRYTQVRHEGLKELGLKDLRNSLFERLFKRSAEKGWHHAYSTLTQQGRMHKDIMGFPNEYFYESELIPLPNVERLTSDLNYPGEGRSPQINEARLIYIPTKSDTSSRGKTNIHEAEFVRELLKELIENIGIDPKKTDIGIITPFRAQIALIKKLLVSKDYAEDITIDTVERYQGSAKDIIILSLCTNEIDQLQHRKLDSNDGIDRKLNVAITRAREQIFILANQKIMESNPLYKDLIRKYTLLNWN